MVGCGFLSPAMEKLRNDTPKALRRLLDNCLNYTRDDRPAFRNVSWKCTRFLEICLTDSLQVLVSLENLMSSLPKIHRSLSEPILNRYYNYTILNFNTVLYTTTTLSEPISRVKTYSATTVPLQRPLLMQICPVLLLLLMYDEAAHFWGTAFGTWRRTWRDALWAPGEVCG